MQLDIKTIIKEKEISRSQVLEWEKRRAIIVLKKLGEQTDGKDLAEMRQKLAMRKRELGAGGLLKILHGELALSDPLAAMIAALSFGSRRFSITELVVSNGTAEHFVEWFNDRARINDEPSMLAGTPDHYIIRTNSDGSQEVVETNGGSPLVARFFIDYKDLSSLRSAADPAYPLQITGVARSKGGRAIGGVRHQFRNEGRGFRAKLLVEYPLLVLPQIISGHRWHLASEFGNWIETAFK